jgi:hypothetical protein
VAAFLQAAPITIYTKEEIDGEEVAGSFDGGKVDLRYFLENAPAPDDESEDAVWSMQLAAAITEIQDGARNARCCVRGAGDPRQDQRGEAGSWKRRDRAGACRVASGSTVEQ